MCVCGVMVCVVCYQLAFVEIFTFQQSFDRSACLWDVRTGRCMKRLDQHESDVNAVRFLPTGDALGTTTNDGVVSSRGVAGQRKLSWSVVF